MTPASPRAENEQPYLHLHGLSKIYASRDGPVRALDQVSLSGRRGEFISIVGPSGCGKSTLLMIAAGLMAPSSGVVMADGETGLAPRPEIGIVFQNPVLLEWRSALGNVMLQAEAKKLERGSAERRARALLAAVGLGGFEGQYPHELSGGLRPRGSVCPGVVPDPPP